MYIFKTPLASRIAALHLPFFPPIQSRYPSFPYSRLRTTPSITHTLLFFFPMTSLPSPIPGIWLYPLDSKDQHTPITFVSLLFRHASSPKCHIEFILPIHASRLLSYIVSIHQCNVLHISVTYGCIEVQYSGLLISVCNSPLRASANQSYTLIAPIDPFVDDVIVQGNMFKRQLLQRQYFSPEDGSEL